MEAWNYRRLLVWQLAHDLAIDVFSGTAGDAFKRDWSLRDQIRRSALSVPSNIAEGNQRGSDKDCVRFLFIAKGSLAEFSTQV